MVSSTPWPHFTPGKDLVPIVQEAGWAPGSVWMGGKISPPLGFDPRTVKPLVSPKVHIKLHKFPCFYYNFIYKYTRMHYEFVALPIKNKTHTYNTFNL
jgi:hypothetical protein